MVSKNPLYENPVRFLWLFSPLIACDLLYLFASSYAPEKVAHFLCSMHFLTSFANPFFSNYLNNVGSSACMIDNINVVSPLSVKILFFKLKISLTLAAGIFFALYKFLPQKLFSDNARESNRKYFDAIKLGMENGLVVYLKNMASTLIGICLFCVFLFYNLISGQAKDSDFYLTSEDLSCLILFLSIALLTHAFISPILYLMISEKTKFME